MSFEEAGLEQFETSSKAKDIIFGGFGVYMIPGVSAANLELTFLELQLLLIGFTQLTFSSKDLTMS